MMDSIASAAMRMSQMQFQNAYDIAMVKKGMEGMEAQAEAFIEMMESVPAPSQYGFDVYG